MMRRMGRPGLIGTMARTAVVAGTATAVAGNVSRRQAERAQTAEPAEPDPAPVSEPTAASAADPTAEAGEPSGEDLSSQLERLATLKTAGVISETEFTAAKARLLGI